MGPVPHPKGCEIAATADVVVVGAGLSGLEFARALVSTGVRDVLVLDAGGEDRACSLRGAGLWSCCPPHYPVGASVDRVGGRSLRWHGVVLRLEGWAWDDTWPDPARAALVGDGQSLYGDVEHDLEAWAGRPLAGTEQNRPGADLSSVALGTAARLVPQAVQRSGDGLSQRAYTPMDLCHGWLGHTDDSRLPRIRPESQALELLVSGGRVSGVRVQHCRSGAIEAIYTRAVVLAAGTLENTRLAARLSDPGTQVAFTGLSDHLVQGFLVRFPGAASSFLSPIESLRYLPADPVSRSNLFARTRPFPGTPEDDLLLDVWAMGEQVRSSLNRVVFGAGRTRSATVTPGLAPADHDVLAWQREALHQVWDTAASAVSNRSGTLRFPDFFTGGRPFEPALEEVAALPYATPLAYAWPLGTVDHESGTLPLGGEHVDETGQLRAVTGVYVVGPATFPRSGAANPSLTTLALARWTALTLASGQ